MRRFVLWMTGAVWLATAGCAGVGTVDDADPTDGELSPGIWDVEAGHQLSLDELAGELDDARFVVVGESHGTPWHHEAQYSIFRALADRRSPVARGLEMIEYRFQEVVDAYLAGEIDEEQLLEDVEWDKRWGVDSAHYASMWRWAREHDHPVVALNARRELVSEVADVGIDGLDDDGRRRLPAIEKDDAYREYLRRIFGAHDTENEEDEGLERFFEAQLVWDETMAQTAWEFVDGRSDVDQMVILTGRGHMERGFGIPPRLVRRGAKPASVVTVVPVSTRGERSGAMEEYRRLEFLRDEKIADYVWIEVPD